MTTATETAPTASTETTNAPFDLFTAVTAVDLSTAKSEAGPVEEGETVVGVMNENLVRLSMVHDQLCDELNSIIDAAREKAVAHITMHSDPSQHHDCDAFHAEMQKVNDELTLKSSRLKLISEIFWAMVKLQFPELHDKDIVVIRENNQVAWKNKDQRRRVVLSGPAALSVLTMMTSGFGMPDGFGDLPNLRGRGRRRPGGL